MSTDDGTLSPRDALSRLGAEGTAEIRRALGARFAGMWVDPGEPSVLHVGVVGVRSHEVEHLERLVSSRAPGVMISVVERELTSEDLDDLQRRLMAYVLDNALGPDPVRAVEPRLDAGVVLVTLSRPDGSAQSRMRSAIAGAPIVFRDASGRRSVPRRTSG